MKDIELIPVNGKFCVTMDTFNQLLDDDNKKKLALEKISSYVTHLLDENMIASKYGQEILNIILECVKDEQN